MDYSELANKNALRTDPCDCACDVNPASKPAYYRTTSRIGDLVLTFLEDGSIGLKRGKDILTTTAGELRNVIEMAANLRDYNGESKRNQLESLDHSIKRYEELIEDLKKTKEQVSNGSDTN